MMRCYIVDRVVTPAGGCCPLFPRAASFSIDFRVAGLARVPLSWIFRLFSGKYVRREKGIKAEGNAENVKWSHHCGFFSDKNPCLRSCPSFHTSIPPPPPCPNGFPRISTFSSMSILCAERRTGCNYWEPISRLDRRSWNPIQLEYCFLELHVYCRCPTILC